MEPAPILEHRPRPQDQGGRQSLQWVQHACKSQARKRAQLQLKVLSVLPEAQLPAYLVRQS